MRTPSATPPSANPPAAGADVLRELWLDWAERLVHLDEDDWGRPTRCDGWSVADLVAHASPDPAGLRQLPDLVTDAPAAVVDAAVLLGDFNRPGGVAASMAPAVAAAASTLAATSTPADLVERFRASAAVLAAMTLPDAAVVPYPVAGTVTVGAMTDVAIVEATVHLWDLVDAVGGPPPAATASDHTLGVLVRVPPAGALVEVLAGRRDPAAVLPVLR